MNITSLDKNSLAVIRADVNAALAAVGKKHGLVFNLGSCKFYPTNAEFKLQVNTITNDGEVIDADKASLMRCANLLGLTAKDIETPISIGATEYKIVGYRRARYARPFTIMRVSDGKRFVTSEKDVMFGVKMARG